MRRRALLGVSLLLVSVLAAGGAQAQTKPAADQAQATAPPAAQTVAGKYEGTAVSPDGPMSITAELKVDNGVVTGAIATPQGPVIITSGSIAGDKFTFGLDMGGLIGSASGTYKDGKFEGEWVLGEQSGTITMAKVGEAGAAPAAALPGAAAPAQPAAAAAPPAAAGDPLTGDWDALIDFGGNQMPFTLSMKLDGQKVTGQMSSDMGGSVPFEGTWTNGTLTFGITGPSGGAIVMAATLTEGRLAGTFTAGNGQFTGGWAAAKRK